MRAVLRVLARTGIGCDIYRGAGEAMGNLLAKVGDLRSLLEGYMPGIRYELAPGDAKQCRFSRSVTAENGYALSALNVQRYAVENCIGTDAV